MPKKKKTTTRRITTAKPRLKAHTKQDQLLALLRRAEGVTVAQAAKALGWQPHSVRGIISGVLKKRLGLTITSDKDDGGRTYRVAGSDARTRA